MAPWHDFDSIFYFNKGFTYDGKTIEHIVSNRRSLENQLFVDKLLGLTGVKAAANVYPPRSNADLRSLVNQITSAPFDDHEKQALIYYILRDCRGPTDASSHFARRCYLPEKYRLFIEGLWYMDRLEFKRAIEYLTEPSIIPTFPDDILYALTLPNLRNHDDTLVIAYYHTACPPLATVKAQRAFFETLCRASVTQAFYFSRKHDELHRRTFLELLIQFVLNTKGGQTRSDRAMELISLPLDTNEEGWFEESLLRGSCRTLHAAKDTVMMRRLATGRLENLSTDLESLSGRKVDGLNWDVLKQSMKHTQTAYMPGHGQLP